MINDQSINEMTETKDKLEKCSISLQQSHIWVNFQLHVVCVDLMHKAEPMLLLKLPRNKFHLRILQIYIFLIMI